jgi:hypothetical protein
MCRNGGMGARRFILPPTAQSDVILIDIPMAFSYSYILNMNWNIFQYEELNLVDYELNKFSLSLSKVTNDLRLI